MLTATRDSTGNLWVEPTDHGLHRRTLWRRRTRARSIAYILEPGKLSTEKSPLKRLKSCGLAKAPDIELRAHLGKIHVNGLMACGNVWTCPTCSSRIRARREVEIEAALAEHCKNGGQIGMMTLTLRHDRSMSLHDTIERLNDSWRRIQRYHRYKPLHSALNGTITTMEITRGDNGWHPHLHILLLTGSETTKAQIDDATDHLRHSWSNLVNIFTDRFSLTHGLDITWFGRDSATAARYVAKLAKEMTLIDSKSGHDPFELLDIESPENTALFIEYALATYRRQMHRWSDGLRARLLQTHEKTDEEVMDENETLGTVVLTLSRELWNSITESERLGWIEFAEAQHHASSP